MEHHKLYGIKINVFKSLKNLAIESANKKQIYVALNSKKFLRQIRINILCKLLIIT